MIHVQLNEISKMVLSEKNKKTLSSVQIPVALHEILLGSYWDSQVTDDDDDPHLGSVTPRKSTISHPLSIMSSYVNIS